MIWFLCNSLYSWNVYHITQLLSSWYSLCGDIKLCMKYSWYYFDAYKWKVMIMNGRMKFDKLIPSWFETFMIWNYACNCFLLWWYMNIMCIMNTLLSYMKIVINILKINVCIMLDNFTFCAWWVIVMIETMIEIIWMMIWNHAYNNEFICFENVHVLIWKYNNAQMRLMLTFVMI